MDKNEVIEELVHQWIKIAERDLIIAQRELEIEPIVTDIICFHCQQAAEKYLKSYLTRHQIEFPKTHSMMMLINLCSVADSSFKEKLSNADMLTDYAVEIRYPDEWYEPGIEEAKKAFELTKEIKAFVLKKLDMIQIKEDEE